jgi:hypothetical protein
MTYLFLKVLIFPGNMVFLSFFFFGGTGVWIQSLTIVMQMLYHLNYSASQFVCVCVCVSVCVCFDRVLRTICQGWLWTVILLFSASWVARNIGVGHQHLAGFLKVVLNLQKKKKDMHYKWNCTIQRSTVVRFVCSSCSLIYFELHLYKFSFSTSLFEFHLGYSSVIY